MPNRKPTYAPYIGIHDFINSENGNCCDTLTLPTPQGTIQVWQVQWVWFVLSTNGAFRSIAMWSQHDDVPIIYLDLSMTCFTFFTKKNDNCGVKERLPAEIQFHQPRCLFGHLPHRLFEEMWVFVVYVARHLRDALPTRTWFRICLQRKQKTCWFHWSIELLY